MPRNATLERTETKPVRIFSDDFQPLRLLAQLQGTSVAGLIHVALAEYAVRHADTFRATYEEAQRLLKRGDLAALTKALSAGAEEHGAQLAADLPRARTR